MRSIDTLKRTGYSESKTHPGKILSRFGVGDGLGKAAVKLRYLKGKDIIENKLVKENYGKRRVHFRRQKPLFLSSKIFPSSSYFPCKGLSHLYFIICISLHTYQSQSKPN